MSTRSNLAAVDLELIRHELASKNKLIELKNTYLKKNPEIFDGNTGDFWNKKNIEPFPTKFLDPMGFDRSITISKWIHKCVKENSKVLNIGSGSGSLEEKIFKSKKKFNWIGIDISSTSASLLNKAYPLGKFMVGSVTKMPFNNEEFELIVLSEVLEHIPPSKVFSALGEVFRVLKSNGYLIVSIPMNEGLEKMLSEGRNPNSHVRIYSLPLVCFELKLSGFAVKKIITLYAFKKWYLFKKTINKIFPLKRNPNNILLLMVKP